MTAAQVEKVNSAFYEAIEVADIDRLERIWVDGTAAELASCVHPGTELVRGRSAVLRSWSLFLANMAYIQFVITDQRTRVCDHHAVVTCVQNMLVAGEEDAQELTGMKVVATNGYLWTPDGWRMWLHHASPVMTDQSPDE